MRTARSVNIEPPKDFLLNAQKQWDSSFIGHFIGGSFAFKFVREQAFKLWKNVGLTRVYYSSKGYFTFRFATVEQKNKVLSLNSVYIGGKPLYMMPWMEGSKFRKNLVQKVPCWIRLVNVPDTYWSRDGLSNIAKGVGKSLKFD